MPDIPTPEKPTVSDAPARSERIEAPGHDRVRREPSSQLPQVGDRLAADSSSLGRGLKPLDIAKHLVEAKKAADRGDLQAVLEHLNQVPLAVLNVEAGGASGKLIKMIDLALKTMGVDTTVSKEIAHHQKMVIEDGANVVTDVVSAAKGEKPPPSTTGDGHLNQGLKKDVLDLGKHAFVGTDVVDHVKEIHDQGKASKGIRPPKQ